MYINWSLVTGGLPTNVDTVLFLQNLRDLSLEEDKAHIQEHIAELSDHASIGNLLADEALRVLYTPFVSLKIAEALIFFGEYVHHMFSHALGLKAKGDALMMIGHHQAAIECLDAAGEEFQRLGDEGNWARSRISWIISAAWLGNVEEALQQAAHARDAFLRLDELYWACVIDHNTALIYDYMGRYKEALKLYESMRIIYPTLNNQSEIFIKRSVALADMNQALNLAWLGNFEESYRQQQQAKAILSVLGETDLIINAEVNLAELDYTQGYYGSALRRYYQARDILIQNKLDDPLLLAELKLCISNCLVKLNRSQEACMLANEAVELYKQFGVSLSTGKALREYATTLAASGRIEEALSTLDQAWTVLNQGKFDSYASTTKLQQAELLLEKGDVAEAYCQAYFIRDYFEAKGMAGYAVRASLVMVNAHIANAQQAILRNAKEQQVTFLQEAILLCKHTALQSKQYNLQAEAYKSHYLLGRIYVLQNKPIKAARHYGEAIVQIEHILDDLVYDLSPSFLQSTWAVYEDMISLCLQHAQLELAFSYLEQARSMALRQYLNKSVTTLSQEDKISSTVLQQNNAALLRVQHELRDEQEQHRYYSVLLVDIDLSVSPAVDREVIQQELKRCEEKISELSERLHLYQSDTRLISQKKTRKTRKVKEMDITQLRQCLSPEQILLAYFLYKDRLIVFVVTKEQLVTRELSDGVGELERLLPLLHAHLNPRGWSDLQKPPEQSVRRLLNKLYDLLVKPVADLLPPSHGHLTIVPYGPLHKLPFHALYNGSRYLIEDFQVSYLPASNVLMHLDARKSEQDSSSTGKEVSTRPPLVFGFSENGHLQRVNDEAKTIASLLNGQCYLEGKATIARLIEQAPGSPIIHLATHGQSRLDAPNFSYVRLADGQLNAIDAFSLDLKACELVTLSGCETGLALSGGGDEQLGLGRAFLAAGASSLVMSLWPVEDKATNELMKLFYHYLLKGESKVQALRAAQCSLLHHTDSTYTHPYFWAAFRLVGEVGSLRSLSAIGRSLAFAANT